MVDCNAIPPTFGVAIGGQTFYHNRQDVILPYGNNVCLSTIGAVVPTAAIWLAFLGDAFLKNIVAVFDFGKNEMRFAARNDSETPISNNPSTTPITTNAGNNRVGGLGGLAALMAVAMMLLVA